MLVLLASVFFSGFVLPLDQFVTPLRIAASSLMPPPPDHARTRSAVRLGGYAPIHARIACMVRPSARRCGRR